MPRTPIVWDVFEKEYKLTHEDQTSLACCVTDMEIKQTLFDIGMIRLLVLMVIHMFSLSIIGRLFG